MGKWEMGDEVGYFDGLKLLWKTWVDISRNSRKWLLIKALLADSVVEVRQNTGIFDIKLENCWQIALKMNLSF